MNLPKDILFEILFLLDIHEVSNFCLTSKYFYNLIWKSKSFWINKCHKDFKVYEDISNYRILHSIRHDPQYYYSRSIHENNIGRKILIEKSFNVHFPYIGILARNDPNFVSLFLINNLYGMPNIPDYIMDIRYIGSLSLVHHAEAMGLGRLMHLERDILVERIKKTILEKSLYFYMGDKNPFRYLQSKKHRFITYAEN